MKDIASKIENLIFVTPEMKSFKSKVGGLGDVSEELGKTLADFGIKVTFVTPLYRHTCKRVDKDGEPLRIEKIDYSDVPIKGTGKKIRIEVAGEDATVAIKKSKIGEADVVFLENDKYADVVYSGDLLKQAIFIGRGSLEALQAMNVRPTIVHYHDALTSLVSFVRIDKRYSEDPFFEKMKLAYTIHNAGRGYQQIFDSSRFDELGVDRIHWDGLVWEGKINLMYAGIFHSQICNTVSNDYAKTLRTDGEGLTEVFMRKNIFGIINGVDFDYWKIRRTKEEAKLDLIRFVKEKTGAALDKSKLTIVMPRRIAFQKGLEIVMGIIEETVRERKDGGIGAQFILLGWANKVDEQGKKWESDLEKLSQELRGKFVFINDFDQKVARLMYEGGDLLFYPSRPDKEPCGTGYMLAMANMTPTIGTNTGGLVEIIEDFNPLTGNGNGFKISKEEYSADAFLKRLREVSSIFYGHKDQWKKLMENAFCTEINFKKIATEYVTKVYQPLIAP